MPLHPSRRSFLGAAAGTALALNLPAATAAAPRFAIGDKDFLLDGKPCRSAAARCISPACRANTGAIA